MTDDRYARGLEQVQALLGDEGAEALVRTFEGIEPDLARYAIESGWAEVYGRPGLDRRQRQLLTIGALTALGGTEPQLRAHIGGALNVGVTPREIVEAIFHLILYVGYPRALNAFGVVREVFAERGIELPLPREDGGAGS